MKQVQQTKRLLRQLGKAPALVDEPDRAAARRSNVVARLQSLMQDEAERQQQERRRHRWLAVATLVAGPVLLIGAFWLLRPLLRTTAAPAPSAAQVVAVAGSVSVSHQGRATVAGTAAELPLSQSDEVNTGPSGEAQISLASGAVAKVAPSTRVRLSAPDRVPAGQREELLELTLGRIELDVPKLAAEQTLAVVTPHARVVVHGTRFSVQVEQQRGARITVVSVAEGVVLVQADGQEHRLEAGSSWSSEPRRQASRVTAASKDKGAPPKVEQKPAAADDAVAAAGPSAAAAGPHHSPRDGAVSTLAEENRLYGQALAARRRGDDRAVVAHLDELIRRYPRSTLLPEARLERARALQRLQPQ